MEKTFTEDVETKFGEEKDVEGVNVSGLKKILGVIGEGIWVSNFSRRLDVIIYGGGVEVDEVTLLRSEQRVLVFWEREDLLNNSP